MSEDGMTVLYVGEPVQSDPNRPARMEGQWVKFWGEEIAKYQKKDGPTYTVYKCTAYDYDAYRVYVEDETDISCPTYELLPYEEDRRRRDYSEPYDLDYLLEEHPIFTRQMIDSSNSVTIDRQRR